MDYGLWIVDSWLVVVVVVVDVVVFVVVANVVAVVPGIRGHVLWPWYILTYVLRIMVLGLRTMDFGLWIMDYGIRVTKDGLWSIDRIDHGLRIEE